MAANLPRSLSRLIMKGEKGREVRAVQHALIANGYRITADGVFGEATQTALRSFQDHKGLFPSGVIDRETIECLSGESEVVLYRDPFRVGSLRLHGGGSIMTLPKPFWGRSYPPKMLSLSAQGFDFIYRLETRPGTSEHTHWPGGASGVTLGPGYDMRERTEADVSRDLAAIGIDPSIAQKLSKGAKKDGTGAQIFADTHKKSLTLSAGQQKKLLKINQAHYEAIIQRLITIDLFQFEYDALVSFTYNPGASVAPVARHINAGEPEKAMKIILSRVNSGGKTLLGLVSRRKAEIALYTRGIYY